MPIVASSSANPTTERAKARPFLKWAGGKRQLLPELRRFVPRNFGSYFEPFAGSAALFFDLWESEVLDERRATLIDSNADLIGCYRAVARDVGAVIAALRRLAAAHEKDPAGHFYLVRDQQFNPARRAVFCRGGDEYPPQLAAMFIYLNRTGFNGLYRLNSKGDFNVPVGRYARPQICDEARLRAVAAALAFSDVAIRQGAFETLRDFARPGDFIYLDPPYAPLNTTAKFTSYTAVGFSDDDQRRLQALVIDLARKGCQVVLSNSTAPLITELYATNAGARRAGLRAHIVAAKRSINSDPARRGEVPEYIISNVRPSKP